jgi:beta-lactamase class A
MLGAAMDKQQKGEIGYYERRALTPEDLNDGGTGFMKYFKEGTQPTLKEILHLMVTASDNVATNLLGRWIGQKAVNDWMDRHGLKTTRLLVPWPDVKAGLESDPALRGEVERWGMGVSTPDEMCRLMVLIAQGQAGTPAACDEMRRILSHQYYDEGIASQIPPWVSVASKSGIMERSRSDVALVRSASGDYVLAVYTDGAQDTRLTVDNEQLQAIRAISRAVWRHYHPGEQRWSPPAGTDRFSGGKEW